jgi:HK97 family phage major capsid protein
MLKTLIEQRDKLFVDAGVILNDANSSQEQLDSALKMCSDATALEQRIASIKLIEMHDAEQREFSPAARTATTRTAEEQRTRATEALRSFMTTNRVDSEYRDVLTTSSSGAAVIPQLFNNELVTALREYAPILSIVDNKVTDNNGAPLKMSFVNYTSTLLAVTTEGSAIGEIDPTYTSSNVLVDKLAGMVKISVEELEDSGFDLAAWLRQQWANVFGVSLEHYCTLGNGSNIAGFTTVAGTGPTTATTATVAYPDIAALYGSVTAAYARNGVFQMNTQTRATLMGLVATTGQPIFDANPAADPFSTIFGRPVIINDSLPNIATGNKPILFGDMKNGYLLRTDGTPTIKRLAERYADTDEVGFIIRTRVGGVSKSAGIAPFNALVVK